MLQMQEIFPYKKSKEIRHTYSGMANATSLKLPLSRSDKIKSLHWIIWQIHIACVSFSLLNITTYITGN
jgi:hypothetical protein